MYLRRNIAVVLLALLIAPDLLWLSAPDRTSSLPPCCGAFTNLRDVVAFYATRDTDPRRWYVVRFDDLPPQYRRNINTEEFPYNSKDGKAPVLTEEDIDALVAFLKTLSDK